MPWEEIGDNLDDYVDTVKYQLPVEFRNPNELNSLEALALANYFKKVSTFKADDPFKFLPGVTEDEARAHGLLTATDDAEKEVGSEMEVNGKGNSCGEEEVGEGIDREFEREIDDGLVNDGDGGEFYI